MIPRLFPLCGILVLGTGSCQKAPGPPSRAMEKTVPTASPGDAASIRKLFDDAAACGDRYQCPPLTELVRRAEDQDDRQVLSVAFGIMSDDQVQSASRLGDAAWKVARGWYHGREQGKTLDADARRLFLDGIGRMLAGNSQSFVIPAYSLLAGMPEGEEIFKQEAINPKRGDDQRNQAIKNLREYIKDLTLARQWLSSKDPLVLDAGITLVDNINHSLIRQIEEELPLLLQTARRPDLPRTVALQLVAHVASHEDEAFLPVLAVLAQSRDAEVQAEARAAMDKVRQAEAARKKG